MIYKTATKPGVQKQHGAGNGPRMTRSFDAAIHNKRVIIRCIDGSTVEGIVTRYTMFWLEVKLNDGRVVYVNKGAIKMIEVLEKEEGRGQVGGEVNGQNKLKKQPGSG